MRSVNSVVTSQWTVVGGGRGGLLYWASLTGIPADSYHTTQRGLYEDVVMVKVNKDKNTEPKVLTPCTGDIGMYIEYLLGVISEREG